MRIDDAMQHAAERHGVALEDVMGPRRFGELVAARWEGWALARDNGHSFAAIARSSGVDHTSVMHGVKKYQEQQR